MNYPTPRDERVHSVDYAKVFLYGFLSVFSFGTVPSYLHRMAPLHVIAPNTEDYLYEDDIEDDALKVAQDIADATRKAYSSRKA